MKEEKVDPYTKLPLNTWYPFYYLKDPKTQKMLVRDDMLDFVSRLLDNSVNISINGVDSFIIDNKEYIEALKKEIKRVTKKGGIIMGTGTSLLRDISWEDEKQEESKREIEELHHDYVYKILKKK